MRVLTTGRKARVKPFVAILLLVSLLAGCRMPGVDQNEPRHYGTNTVAAQPLQPSTTPKQLTPLMIAVSHGTNYLGTYLGMMAIRDWHGGVVMYSATTGEMLKWVSFQDFQDIFVLKTKPEYQPQ